MCKVFDCEWRRLLIRSCLPHDALGLAWKLAPHSILIWYEPIVISGYQPLPVPKPGTTVFSKCWLALCDVYLCCDWLFCLSPVWVSNANQRQKNKPELVVNANITCYESLTFVNCVGLENFVLWTLYHWFLTMLLIYSTGKELIEDGLKNLWHSFRCSVEGSTGQLMLVSKLILRLL